MAVRRQQSAVATVDAVLLVTPERRRGDLQLSAHPICAVAAHIDANDDAEGTATESADAVQTSLSKTFIGFSQLTTCAIENVWVVMPSSIRMTSPSKSKVAVPCRTST